MTTFRQGPRAEPARTPSRHIELSGQLYLARSRKRLNDSAYVLPVTQAVTSDPSAHLRSMSDGPSGTANEAPEHPVSVPGSWRQQINPRGRVTMSNYGDYYQGTLSVAVFLSVLTLAGWAVNAVLLAWAKEPHEWLALAAITGFVSLVVTLRRRGILRQLILWLSAVSFLELLVTTRGASIDVRGSAWSRRRPSPTADVLERALRSGKSDRP
jgi:hypothetical protein